MHESTPRFRCPERGCPFRLGWVIRPTSKLEPIVVLEQRDDGDGHLITTHVNRDSQACVAIPVDAAGGEQNDLAVAWPRRSS